MKISIIIPTYKEKEKEQRKEFRKFIVPVTIIVFLII